jgi:site-specific recombinase XerD
VNGAAFVRIAEVRGSNPLSSTRHNASSATFEARRNTALLMLLLDTGARRAEMVGLKLADVDLELDVLLVLGKDRRVRTLPFGRRAGEALDRYLRARTCHKCANLPWLWLGQNGRLADTGLRMVMRRRGSQVGLSGLHPHHVRHTFAHEWLAPGRHRGRPHAHRRLEVPRHASALRSDVTCRNLLGPLRTSGIAGLRA